MFTGIVQTTAHIVTLEKKPGLHSMTLDVGDLDIKDLTLGASVAVNGTCLTVTHIQGSQLSFDMMAATLQDTMLGQLKPHDVVNIERSARFGDEIGGHLLSGHVQGVATITAIDTPVNNIHITCTLPTAFQQYIFAKGYIALNGMSLTIQTVQANPFQFTVSIIPETLKRTNIRGCKVGDSINFEIDPQTVTIVETVKQLHNAGIPRKYSMNDQ